MRRLRFVSSRGHCGCLIVVFSLVATVVTVLAALSVLLLDDSFMSRLPFVTAFNNNKWGSGVVQPSPHDAPMFDIDPAALTLSETSAFVGRPPSAPLTLKITPERLDNDHMIDVPLRMFPALSAARLPLLRIPTEFRTAVQKEKPRSCFLLSAAVAAEFNVSTVNSALREVAGYSPERIPQLAYCAEDYIAAGGDPRPTRPDATYSVGFVFDGERCSTNMWHGMLEVVLPVLGAKALVALRDLGIPLDIFAAPSREGRDLRRTLLASDALLDRVVQRLHLQREQHRHVLLMRAPRKNIWGVHNLGCPILNHYPYGWATNSVSGWLLFALFDPVAFSKSRWPHPKKRAYSAGQKPGDPEHIYFFTESPSTNRKYEMRNFGLSRTIAIEEGIFYGPASICRWSRAFDMPPRSQEPYYLFDDPLCPWVYEVAKRFALKQADLEETPVTLSSLRCPKIGVVVRRSYHNGRGIRNFPAILHHLREYVQSGGPVVDPATQERAFDAECGSVDALTVEADVPFGEQMRQFSQLDFVVGARGMGLTNAMFMKRGAGLLVLSGRETQSRLNIPNDNYPWHPLHALRPWNPAVLSSCAAVFPTADFLKRTALAVAAPNASSAIQELSTYAKRCISRSVNFCDMACDVQKVVEDFSRLVMMVRSLASDSSQKPWVDRGVSEYLYIADPW